MLRARFTASHISGNTIEVVDQPVTWAPLESQDLKNSYLSWTGSTMKVEWNNDFPSYFLPVYNDMYGTFRLNFHRFDRFELDLRGCT